MNKHCIASVIALTLFSCSGEIKTEETESTTRKEVEVEKENTSTFSKDGITIDVPSLFTSNQTGANGELGVFSNDELKIIIQLFKISKEEVNQILSAEHESGVDMLEPFFKAYLNQTISDLKANGFELESKFEINPTKLNLGPAYQGEFKMVNGEEKNIFFMLSVEGKNHYYTYVIKADPATSVETFKAVNDLMNSIQEK